MQNVLNMKCDNLTVRWHLCPAHENECFQEDQITHEFRSWRKATHWDAWCTVLCCGVRCEEEWYFDLMLKLRVWCHVLCVDTRPHVALVVTVVLDRPSQSE